MYLCNIVHLSNIPYLKIWRTHFRCSVQYFCWANFYNFGTLVSALGSSPLSCLVIVNWIILSDRESLTHSSPSLQYNNVRVTWLYDVIKLIGHGWSCYSHQFRFSAVWTNNFFTVCYETFPGHRNLAEGANKTGRMPVSTLKRNKPEK